MMGTARAPLAAACARSARRTISAPRPTGGARWLSASPLRGRRIVEVLATSTGGVGTHVRSIVPALRAAGAAVQVCGAPATEELFGFTAAGADVPPGRHLGRAWRRSPTAAPSLQLRRALAGADLVHAHGLRAGLVAATARRLVGRAARPLVLTLHNALPESGGPRQRRAARGSSGLTIRGADLVLAVSSDLADNARRLGARDVRVAPALAPPLPPGRPAPATRSARSSGVDDGRPLRRRRRPAAPAEGLRRPARRRRALGAPTAAPAGAARRHRRRRPAARPSSPSASGPSGCRSCCSAAAPTSPTCSAPPTLCVLPSRWEAQPVHRAGGAAGRARRWSPRRAGGLPELLGDGAELVPVGDAAALADAVVRVLDRSRRTRRELVEAGRRPGRDAGPTRQAGRAAAGRRLPRAARAHRRRPAMSRPGRAAALLARPADGAARAPPPVAGARTDDGDATADRVARRRRPRADLERRRSRGDAGAVGAGRGVADRRPVGARRPLDHLPPRRLGHPRRGQPRARARAPTRGCRRCRCRPCRCPTTRPRRQPDAGPDGDEPEPPMDTSLSHCGLQERAAEVALIDPEADRRAHRRRRGHRPLRRRARRAGRGGRLRHGVRPGGHAGRRGARRGRSRAPTRCPTDPGQLAGVLAGCPLALVVARPADRRRGARGRRKTDDGTEPEPRAAALLRIDAGGRPAARPRSRRCRATRCSCWPGSPRSTTAARSCTWGWPSGPGFAAAGWLTLGQHRPGAVRPAHRRRADRAARARPGPAGLDERPAAAGRAGERPALARGRAGARADQHRGDRPPPQHRRLLLDRWWSSSAALVGLGMLVLGGLRGRAGRVRRSPGRRVLADGWRSRRPRCRSPPTWPGSSRGSAPARPALALVAAVVAADLVVAALAAAGSLAAAPPRAAAGRARRDARHPRRRRAHRLDPGAQRAAGLRRDRRRPVHRVRQPHASACCRSAR